MFRALALEQDRSPLPPFPLRTDELHSLHFSQPPMFLHSLFIQDQKDPSPRSSPRKSLYRRAAEAMGLWKPIKTPSPSHTNNGRKLKKCSSLRIASSFTHVCLCAPVSFYNDALRTDDSRPRRSISRSRSRSSIFQRSRSLNAAALAGPRASVDHGRRAVFRGKSLTDDVLMRRFVLEEEAMMHVRRRNEVEIIRRRIAMRRGKLGPSRLSRMVMAGEEDQI